MSNKITFLIESGKQDRDGDIILPGAFKNIPTTVPLTKDFDPGQIIGRCNVFRENGEIKGEVEISDEMKVLTPAFGFQIKKSHFEGDTLIIEEAIIHLASLNIFPNADPNVKSIKEQLGG